MSPGRLVLHELRRRQRHDLVVEAAGLLGRGGAQLALQRVLVLRLAADLVALRHDLGGVDHRHVDLGLVLVEPLVVQAVRVLVLVLHEADRLDPARDHHRHAVDDHPLRRERDRLQAGRAEAVDGRAARRHRQPGPDRRLARDVVAGRAFRQRAADEHVLDLAGLDAGALDGVLDHVAGKRRAVGVVEGAAIGLADRRAGGRDDDGVGHGRLLPGRAAALPDGARGRKRPARTPPVRRLPRIPGARNPPRAHARGGPRPLNKGEEGTPKMDLKGRPACGVPAVLSPRPHRTGRFQPPRPPLFGDPLRGRPLRDDLRGAFSALRARPARCGRGADVFGPSLGAFEAPSDKTLQSRRPPESDATERATRDRLPSACMTRGRRRGAAADEHRWE